MRLGRKRRVQAGASVTALGVAAALSGCGFTPSAPAVTLAGVGGPSADLPGAVAPRSPGHGWAAQQPRAGVLPRPQAPHRATDSKRPNVLMITADDAAPGDLKYMPHVQQLLVDQGVTFSDAIAPTPICVPARASLLTGQYTHNHKAYTIFGQGGGFTSFDSARTLPTWLRAAGYHTMFVGKYLNGYGDTPASELHVEPGWSQWYPTVGGSTYNFLHPIMNMNGKRLVHYNEYNSTLFSDKSNALLAQAARGHKPWFMWVNYVAPHEGGPTEYDDPQMVYPQDKSAWVPTTVPAPQDKNRFAHIALPAWGNLFKRGHDEPSAGADGDANYKAATRYAFEERIEALQSVDRAVARTVATLRAHRQLQKTYIIFASDNGYLTGQHNRNGKLVQFDDSLRIPMVLRGPGIPRHRVVRTAITNPDVATTIAAMTHVKPKRVQDGVNMLPWLTRGYRERIVPIEAYPLFGGIHPIYTGIREGAWTYVRYTKGAGWEELYNRRTDPWELWNLAGDPTYAPQLAFFRRLDRRYRECAGATCPKRFMVPGAPGTIEAVRRAPTPSQPTVTDTPAPVTALERQVP